MLSVKPLRHIISLLYGNIELNVFYKRCQMNKLERNYLRSSVNGQSWDQGRGAAHRAAGEGKKDWWRWRIGGGTIRGVEEINQLCTAWIIWTDSGANDQVFSGCWFQERILLQRLCCGSDSHLIFNKREWGREREGKWATQRDKRCRRGKKRTWPHGTTRGPALAAAYSCLVC